MTAAHGRLKAMARLAGAEDARDLSRILLRRCSAGSAAHADALGLAPEALAGLLEACFPGAADGWTPGACFAAHMQRQSGGHCACCSAPPAAPLPAPAWLLRDERAFRDLLLRNRGGASPLTELFADLIARAALESDHLWCSLGLAERSHLAGLLDRHFHPLAAANTGKLRWKRFFYDRLWAEGRPASWETVCDACAHYGECYGDGVTPPPAAAAPCP